ncbi:MULTISPECIES: CobW family GTP-binding protein [Halomonas]|uniref:Cobalamin biosynthesis protein CobW n=1 Tax=Halomonas halophila TaxID=29573 RepID=A0ABQ0U363_9GAMM|nr:MULTISPECIES: GTP-binding protein [Halomonas]MDR5890236.1 GTP-binding protein [Halomonas salina]WJY05845.1 GTP-binding protein [Halomonas halophila]GEK72890.1 cobalamin biosynthesis protein CobW [Halomonas halophila]
MARPPLRDIPAHLITGFLGGGKSTLIHHLIAHKPPGERWAVLINEFGQVGVDQTMFAERDDVVVQALPGGCLCCQLATVLQTSLVQLLRRERPDRLIIEPSGLGHPSGLIELLRGEAFAGVLSLRDVVTVLDPRRLDDPRARGHETFLDQLRLADGVALTMVDRLDAARVTAARDWLAETLPGERWVVEAPHGRLPVARLLEGGAHREGAEPASPAAHRAQATAQAQIQTQTPGLLLDLDARAPRVGAPVRESGASLGHESLGWRWHADEVFAAAAITAWLDALPAALRVKGVLHTDTGWVTVNRARNDAPLSPSEWRRDSRLELIAEAGGMPDAEALEAGLVGCRRSVT